MNLFATYPLKVVALLPLLLLVGVPMTSGSQEQKSSLSMEPSATEQGTAEGDTYASWELTVASWNLMNFSLNKATFSDGTDRANLLTRIGGVAGGYDILVFQEVLENGDSVTQHLVNYLPHNYACNHVSAASGRVGRQERYVVCAPPNNASGAIAVTAWTDYSTTGNNYLAANGTMQPAANVWMRPPIIATITFTPNDPTFQPITFDLYTNHTKPAYGYSAHARPPGTVTGAPNNSSVHYELRAIEQNQQGGANRMLIGDLNADCASYGTTYRGLDFSAGWNWYIDYGQRTNTAVGTACGYDRILLNDSLNAYYLGHGIDYDNYGNATYVDGKRVSDHYLVWVQLGERQKVKRTALMASISAPVTQAKRQRKFKTSDSINATGTQLQPSTSSASFFITTYSTSRNYKSNFTYSLVDVRGAPTPVSTDANGDLKQTVTWASPEPGAYVFVFDANGDGEFSLADGDFANFDTQADILVTEDSTGHSDLVTLGDNMVLRDVFDLGQAQDVYALAKNLPASHTAYAYIVSDLLLKEAGYTSWEQAREAGIDLASYSIPIQLANSGMIVTSQLTDDDRRQTFTTNPDGETFFSVWPHPAQLMNATVDYQAPPTSVFKPEFAGDGDPPDSPDDTEFDEDPCKTSSASVDQDFQQACNLGFLFGNYYGNAFNVVFDIDGDGKLSPNDPVDTRDIGDMTKYFSGNEVLGPNANGNSAVSEYKEYLERALSVDLSDDNIYNEDTKAASGRYACGPELTKDDFETLIVADSQTGFRVLDDDAYQSERSNASGLYQYDNALLSDWSATNATQCISGNDLSYGGAIASDNSSHITAVADTHSFYDAQVTPNDSINCWIAVEGAATTTFLIAAGTSVVTFGTSLLVGAVVFAEANLVGASACGYGTSQAAHENEVPVSEEQSPRPKPE